MKQSVPRTAPVSGGRESPFVALASTRQSARWRPGVVGGACHNELFASLDEASGVAMALALASDRLAAEQRAAQSDPLAQVSDQRNWLWVQDKRAIQRSGRPYRPGLPAELRHRLVHVAAKTTQDALFALEEGLRCRELAFVIGEVTGNAKALDFTSSRRLTLTAEKHGVPLYLVRLDAQRDLSSARMRWQVRGAASPPPRWNSQAPGMPSWHAELFRARGHIPGQWMMRDGQHGLLAERAPDNDDSGINTGGAPASATPDSVAVVRAAGNRPLAAC